ncbi:hypothetical protein LOTGIDRAFT_162140 [Lottia gigantea]|uniref:TIR domain-containing protein n=1 Tax=Lottia gigantea TaxID=225164 RepID=V4BVQ8_LOTGI|nr:hypothetical protein LOTGIDRAFT_162140 [Lottia gigantea]ESO93114.1 hypothetical protein LOTGIDRAFT_162140 [Lottia gigantea]
MHACCVIGFISAFIVFGLSGSSFEYTVRSHVNDISASNRIKRSSKATSRYDVSNAYGELTSANGYAISKDGYDVLNKEGYGVSKVNEDNKIMYLEEYQDSNETELRVPCVNNTTNQSVCFCSLDGTFTDCSRRNLTFFPIVPLETKTLNMSGNSLKKLDQDSLTNISTLSKSLKSLDISKNQISYIENGSLSNFTVLKILDVSVNHISNIAIENLTSGISTQLEHLILEGLQLKELPYHSMPNLNNTRLSTFSVKNNSIKNVSSTEIFQSLKKLKYLDLSFNSIRQINVEHSESLESLSLSSNELTGIPHCCKNGAKFPNLTWLYLDDNCIHDLHTDRLDCLDKLELLNISATRIKRVPKNAFARFKSLQRLTLERTESLRHLDSYAFNSSSLKRVYIRFNQLAFTPEQVDTKTILQLCRGLLKLDFSGNYMSMLNHTLWDDLLQNLSDLQYLDISYSGILFLPHAIQHLTKLRSLHVINTWIKTIPKGYFSKLTDLKVLFLKGNKLTTIKAQDFPPSFTNHLYIIDISYNPFVCNCDLLWFIEFTNKNKHKMDSFPKRYTCSNIENVQITNSKINIKSCLLAKETSKIIQCTCIATFSLMLLISVVYRYRWRLRYMFYVLKFHRRKYSTKRGTAYTHDVYISSADANFNTVYYQIIMELENRGLKVYFPHRDGMPGTMVLGDCLDKIDDSKCVILCLSNAYTHDYLCEFEAHMALERSFIEHGDSNALIVIVLEEICSLNVTKIIHKLTRTGDYLIWDENHTSDNLFWRQLGERMEIV